MTSILIGTLGLSIALFASLVLAIARARIATAEVNRVRRAAGAALFFQLGHCIEEVFGRFYQRFPEVFGLAHWPREFFLTFNFIWLVVWLMSIMAIRTFPRISAFPLWFLAISSMANGIGHPILYLNEAGYFPGLWTSPLVGMCGIVLFRSLMSVTHGRHSYISAHDPM